MFITVVNGQITHYCPNLREIAYSLRELDSYAAAYVEVFERTGNANDILASLDGSRKEKKGK